MKISDPRFHCALVPYFAILPLKYPYRWWQINWDNPNESLYIKQAEKS
jgi:hypothetical protein